MQTARDIAQREWRIRNPHVYTGIQKLPHDKHIEKLLSLIQNQNIQHMSTEALSLILSPHNVHYLICPSNEVEALCSSLESTPFKGVEIKSL